MFEITPYAARVRRCTRCPKLNHTAKFRKRSIQICPRCGGRGHGREGCSASPSYPHCSGPHSAAWLGYPEYRTRLLANKIKSQTYKPYNYALRQAKRILHNNNATNRPAHTAPQFSHAGQPQNQQQTATHKTVSYANIVRQGGNSDCTQTKTTQTSPKPTHCNTPQTSTLQTQCTKQAQTQHTTVGR